MAYKAIQLTNNAIPAVAAGGLIPLGRITRRVNANARCSGLDTFMVGTSAADTITITEPGIYRIAFSASLVPTATGQLTVSLLENDTVLTSETRQATADVTLGLSFMYLARVLPNTETAINVPAAFQLQQTVGAINSGISNLIIEKVYG